MKWSHNIAVHLPNEPKIDTILYGNKVIAAINLCSCESIYINNISSALKLRSLK